MHQASVVSAWRFAGRPARAGLDQRADAHIVSRDLVSTLGVVAGIRQHILEPPARDASPGVEQQRFEVGMIRPHSDARARREDEMAFRVASVGEFRRASRGAGTP